MYQLFVAHGEKVKVKRVANAKYKVKSEAYLKPSRTSATELLSENN